MTETWKDIIGYEGHYLISNYGRVMSLERQYVGKGGTIRTINESVKKAEIDVDGYIRYSLCKGQKYKHFKRSVLIARHFIPNPFNLPVVRHLNDIKTDDSLPNLAWGTQKQNKEDAARNGKIAKGERHGMYGRKNNIQANPQTKLILDLNTGVYYTGTREAAFAKNMNRGTLVSQLNGQSKNKTSLVYV